MISSGTSASSAIAVVRPEERPWAALSHGLGWIPVWGFVFNCLLWLYFKNRSRQMIFHVQQAIQFQIFVLLAVLVWAVNSIVVGVLRNLSESVGGILQTANTFLLVSALTACAAAGIWGGALVYLGKPFLYPFFGRRVLEGSIRKISEG